MGVDRTRRGRHAATLPAQPGEAHRGRVVQCDGHYFISRRGAWRPVRVVSLPRCATEAVLLDHLLVSAVGSLALGAGFLLFRLCWIGPTLSVDPPANGFELAQAAKYGAAPVLSLLTRLFTGAGLMLMLCTAIWCLLRRGVVVLDQGLAYRITPGRHSLVTHMASTRRGGSGIPVVDLSQEEVVRT